MVALHLTMWVHNRGGTWDLAPLPVNLGLLPIFGMVLYWRLDMMMTKLFGGCNFLGAKTLDLTVTLS